MGNYASTTELKARFENDAAVADATDTGETGTPDDAVLNEVLNDAEGLVNSSVGMRYSIPVDVSSDTGLAARLKSLSLDLAVHRLLVRGGIESDLKQRSNDEALAYLDEISKGTKILPSAATLTGTASRNTMISSGVAGTGDNTKRLFTRATQDGI